MTPLPAPSLHEIEAARRRIEGIAIRTPLLRLGGGDGQIFIKLENLQPIGSFKLRGAANTVSRADPADVSRGLATASAGNMAQVVAWLARRRDVPCTVVVPDTAPPAKLEPVERLGGRLIRVTFDRWWQTLSERRFPGVEGLFIHPFADRNVIAGNATIGLEIVEDLPDVAAIVVPFGGGGLSTGIAAAVSAVGSGARCYAAEVETAAPFAAALAAGHPAEVTRTPSFVDGIGSSRILEEMWPLASGLLHASIVVSVEDVADAVRLLAERGRVIAEGAGAAAVAAARAGRAGPGPAVAVVSGGGIDPRTLATILRGELP